MKPIDKAQNIVMALGITMLIVVFNSIFFHLVFPNYNFPRFPKEILKTEILVFICTIPPLIEEFVFRFLPLKLLSKVSIYEDIKWYAVLSSACVFGWIHGSSVNILVQGIVGF